MKYKLQNLIYQEGVTPADARSHKNEKYAWITAELFNEADPFGNPARLPRFYIMEPGLIERFKPYLEPIPGSDSKKVNEASMQEAINKGDCLPLLTVSNVFMVEWPLAEPYVRLDRETKQPILNKNGDIVPISTLVLYLKKTQDVDTNEWQWVESPASVATRVLSRSYRPLALIQGANPAATAAGTTAPEPSSAEETPEQRIARLQAELAEATGK
jgi:hypothetical protein